MKRKSFDLDFLDIKGGSCKCDMCSWDKKPIQSALSYRRQLREQFGIRGSSWT